MNFRDFTSGYAVGSVYVLTTNDSHAVVRDDHFEALQTEFGGTYPLVMKVGTYHVCVYPSSAVPSGTLLLPAYMMQALDWSDWQKRQVYLGKPGLVQRLIEWSVVPALTEL